MCACLCVGWGRFLFQTDCIYKKKSIFVVNSGRNITAQLSGSYFTKCLYVIETDRIFGADANTDNGGEENSDIRNIG